MKKIFEKCASFQWDEGNAEKNKVKHNVSKAECEQVFFNQPIIISDAKNNYESEKRWYLLGRTDIDRRLFVVFTIRINMIRVISARDMSKKERALYNETIKKDTQI